MFFLKTRSLTAGLALAAITLQDDPLAVLGELPSARVNVAVERYDKSVSALLLEFEGEYQPLVARWNAADQAHDALRSTARLELQKGLRDSVANTARESRVTEALRIEEALLALESGADPPLLPPVGRPARGSKKWRGHAYLLIDEHLDWHAARERCAELVACIRSSCHLFGPIRSLAALQQLEVTTATPSLLRLARERMELEQMTRTSDAHH